MNLTLRILNSVLILFMAWMSLRAGWGMMTHGPAMVKFFEPFGTAPILRQLLGAIGFVGCLMMFFPKTFAWGSWLNLGVIMFLLVQFAYLHDWKGLLGESWVVALAFIILALGHPLAERTPH